MPHIRYSAEVRQHAFSLQADGQYIVVQVLKKSLATCECSAKRSTMAESPIRPIDKGTGAVLHSVLASAKRNGLNEFELSIGERYWFVFRM